MSEHGERSEHTGAPSELAATPADVERDRSKGPDLAPIAAVDAGVVLVAGAVLLRLALWALGEPEHVPMTPADAADLAGRAVGEVAALAQVLAPLGV